MNLPTWWNAPWWSVAGTVVSFVVLVVTVVFFIVSLSIARRNRREDQVQRRQDQAQHRQERAQDQAIRERDRVADQAAREASERERRISNIVEGYLRLAAGPVVQDTGVHALVVAGVKELRDSEEIEDALRRIVKRVGAGTFGAELRGLKPEDLKKFFDSKTAG
jgi:hypothetical protein